MIDWVSIVKQSSGPRISMVPTKIRRRRRRRRLEEERQHREQMEAEEIASGEAAAAAAMSQQNELSTSSSSSSIYTEMDEEEVNNEYEQVQQSVTTETYLEITLERQNPNGCLGFSIAGGTDNDETGIYVTKIIPDGIAALEGQLRISDQIIRTNNTTVVNVTHQQAVDALKNAGNVVKLCIRRQHEQPGQPTTDITTTAVNQTKNLYEIEVIKQTPQACLGFSIAGGIGNQHFHGDNGIYVTKINENGMALAAAGRLAIGDKLVAVGSGNKKTFINLENVTHDQAVAALKTPDTHVHLIIQKPTPVTMARRSPDHQQQRTDCSFYVRALQFYDSARDCPLRGLLSFKYGDILHVISACDDDEWWQAKLLVGKGGADEESGSSSVFGLIPSKQRWERKKRASDRSVKFGGKQSQNEGAACETHAIDKRAVPPSKLQPTKIYELVKQIQIHYKRPVIILGLWKNRISEDLITEFPEKFANCVPHTTRPPRGNEMNGRDYYFLESRQEVQHAITQGQFIEVGQYNENFYGTSLQSIRQVVAIGKHCILDVCRNAAVRRLQLANTWPIVVFVKAAGIFDDAIKLNRREQHARKFIEKLDRIEHEFSEYFTAILQVEPNTTYGMIYERTKQIIEQNSDKIWIATGKDLTRVLQYGENK